MSHFHNYHHILLMERNSMYDSFIAHKEIATNIFEYDHFRYLNAKNKMGNRVNDIRENSLLSSLVETNYKESLIKDPILREKIFLNTHILFVDFIRKSYDYHNHHIDQEHVKKEDVNNPQNRYLLDDIQEDKELDNSNYTLGELASIQDIPLHLRNDTVEELNNNMSVIQALTLLRSNIHAMKSVGLSNAEFIIYIVTYYMFISELQKKIDKLSNDEINLLKDLQDETEVLYLSIQVNISNEKLCSENTYLRNELSKTTVSRDSYLNVLERIDKIEIIFINHEDISFNNTKIEYVLRDITYEYNLKNNENNTFTINMKNPNEIFSLYKFLYEYYYTNSTEFIPLLIIKPDGQKIDTQDTFIHKIEAKSTSWSYVFYRLYGPRVPFSEERDKTVKSILELSNVNGIPLDLLLPKVDGSKVVH